MAKDSDVRDRDQRVFELARDFLLDSDPRIPTILDKYLSPEQRPSTLNEVYWSVLESCINANMRRGVILGGIGTVAALKPVLSDFDPTRVTREFGDPDKLLDQIIVDLKPKGQIRRVANGIWPLFCRSIISAAHFLSRFESATAFYRWADMFQCDPKAYIALPVILARHIDGLGFALACDFVKELGYENYPKPDVQLRDIFTALGLSKQTADDYELFTDIVRVARHNRVTPYHADKVFWLIGSGRFYLDNFDLGSRKKEFIGCASAAIRKPRVLAAAKI